MTPPSGGELTILGLDPVNCTAQLGVPGPWWDRLPHFRLGISSQALQNITLGGAMIALPIFLQIKLEYSAMQTGLSLAPLSLTMFAIAMSTVRPAPHPLSR